MKEREAMIREVTGREQERWISMVSCQKLLVYSKSDGHIDFHHNQDRYHQWKGSCNEHFV